MTVWAKFCDITISLKPTVVQYATYASVMWILEAFSAQTLTEHSWVKEETSGIQQLHFWNENICIFIESGFVRTMKECVCARAYTHLRISNLIVCLCVCVCNYNIGHKSMLKAECFLILNSCACDWQKILIFFQKHKTVLTISVKHQQFYCITYFIPSKNISF